MGTKKNLDLVCLGEILIDMFPAEIGCRLAEVSAFLPKPGGASANVAVAVSKLGRKSAFIGKVGEDAFGHQLIETLKGQGVETRGLKQDHEVRTTLAFIAMPDENSAEIIFYRNPGADACLCPDELDFSLLEHTCAFHCGSLSLTVEPVRTTHHAAVDRAKKAGALISFDVNYRPSLWNNSHEALAAVWEMIKKADLVKVNEAELRLLTGSDDPAEAAPQLLKSGPALVAVTLGPQGSYFCSARGGGFVPPFRVKTVDAIGCGDAFISGLLCKLIEGGDWRGQLEPHQLEKAFYYANAVGAVTALTRGVIPALPTAARVAEFIKEYQENLYQNDTTTQ